MSFHQTQVCLLQEVIIFVGMRELFIANQSLILLKMMVWNKLQPNPGVFDHVFVSESVWMLSSFNSNISLKHSLRAVEQVKKIPSTVFV